MHLHVLKLELLTAEMKPCKTIVNEIKSTLNHNERPAQPSGKLSTTEKRNPSANRAGIDSQSSLRDGKRKHRSDTCSANGSSLQSAKRKTLFKSRLHCHLVGINGAPLGVGSKPTTGEARDCSHQKVEPEGQ